MKNYKVEQAGGEVTFYQFEDDDPGLAALQAAAKAKTSDVVSVTAADPPKSSSPDLQKASA